ncbi:Gfo/Idh/MocA family oxidoreductase [Pseudoxanthomonas sp. PXM02]|uniref:Gfo/Idh/MocA family protein n=1 Tax=Pseudoxanthomonas sp. PXM02 TaxID=2769294 RepID=UPI001784F858|nr:Gfo/Idh/MocA family oxidoreductase [Pseudoxanthomonas sp. PXM02]MBD9478434.1 Gfo/Idh/MocA family oxidoreductase [Pseudoxanthomonas sp. PXM02]
MSAERSSTDPSRRRLLGALGAASFATLLPVARARASRPLGVALVGLGYYSRDLLAPALQMTRHCRLAGIVTGTPAKAKEWQRRYRLPDRNVYDYDGFDRIADNPDIDVVYVVLPNHLHKPFTLRAAAVGKHVWCEKPMAMDAAEARAMIDACQHHRVQLAIGYRMQHEPNTQAVMALAASKPFGRLQRIRAEAGFRGFDGASPDNWRLDPARGGGAMYDMGVYALNAARYTAGAEPVAVTATQEIERTDLFRGVDETMRFRLEFPEGVIADGETSFGRNMNLLRADCADGWYELSPFQAYEGVRGEASDGRRFDAVIGATPAQQARQMDADALAILEKRAPRVPGEEGWRDMRVLDAIFASARAGGSRMEIAAG